MGRKQPTPPPDPMPVKPDPPPAPPTIASACALTCEFLEFFEEWVGVATGQDELQAYYLEKLL